MFLFLKFFPTVYVSHVNKDWRRKDQDKDKDQTCKDKDKEKDQTLKDKDKDQDQDQAIPSRTRIRT